MLSLAGKRPVWSSGVFFQQDLALPPASPPDVLYRSIAGPRLPHHPHTRADPFLFERDGRLFLFVETQTLDDPGRIEVAEVTGGLQGELRPVLQEPFHLSYPHVFAIGDALFMLPETAASGEVRLYRFEQFPDTLRYLHTLLKGDYTDPSPVLVDGIWYVFATSPRGLELFFTDDLLTTPLREHPSSPVSADPRYSRSAGVPFPWYGELVRPAQDCSVRYGGNVNLVRIDRITPEHYAETPIVHDLLTQDRDWNGLGGHHVHVCPLVTGGYAVAIDGQAADSMVNKITARLWMKLFR